MRNILLFFVDGIGIGPEASSNPFSTLEGTALYQLAGKQTWCAPFSTRHSSDLLVRPIDATLGIEGLPQSGTGQASLLTGVNCARIVGRHFGPFPHSRTHPTLDAENVFRKVQEISRSKNAVAFANAFPPQYFEASRRRSTVTTHCCRAAGVELRDQSALQDRRALPADLTGRSWRRHLHLDVAERSLAEAATILTKTAVDHSFTLFEYFLTDKVGHKRIDTAPATLLQDLNQFFEALLKHIDPSQDTLLLTSDHGNLEDTSHTQHTRNPVPLIVYGWAAPYFEHANDLTDVTPAIVDALRSTTTSPS